MPFEMLSHVSRKSSALKGLAHHSDRPDTGQRVPTHDQERIESFHVTLTLIGFGISTMRIRPSWKCTMLGPVYFVA